MAFSLPNAPYKSDWAQPYPDFGEALNKGIKRGFEPRSQAEELLGNMLKNKNEGIKSKYAEDLAKATLAHQQALTEKARRGPAPVLSNLEKAIAGTQRVKEQYGENSPEYKASQSYVQRLAQGSQGLQLTTDPTTGALTSLSFGGSGRGGPQSALTTDSEGNQVIVSKPTTAQATAQQCRRSDTRSILTIF